MKTIQIKMSSENHQLNSYIITKLVALFRKTIYKGGGGGGWGDQKCPKYCLRRKSMPQQKRN